MKINNNEKFNYTFGMIEPKAMAYRKDVVKMLEQKEHFHGSDLEVISQKYRIAQVHLLFVCAP